MFTLTFGYSTSKNYSKALEIAHELGGSMEKGIMSIELQDYELLYGYEKLNPLLLIIQNWKSISGSFNGQKVEVFKFLYNLWRNVADCAQGRNDSWDNRHCWSNIDNEGWGCKLLNSFSAYNYGEGNYKRSNRFWYNFGDYDGNRVWKVNKHLIFEKLQKEIDSKNLTLCPFFNIDRIKKIVEELPEIISLDDVTFTAFYNEEGKMVNIRHVKLVKFNKPAFTYSFN